MADELILKINGDLAKATAVFNKAVQNYPDLIGANAVPQVVNRRNETHGTIEHVSSAQYGMPVQRLLAFAISLRDATCSEGFENAVFDIGYRWPKDGQHITTFAVTLA
ncbi:MAG: hypothetical protein GC136_10245 [Alphaproteobacteria bacterium]|nr:hypothetical protein [Alphaproteobacteria bacterium]